MSLSETVASSKTLALIGAAAGMTTMSPGRAQAQEKPSGFDHTIAAYVNVSPKAPGPINGGVYAGPVLDISNHHLHGEVSAWASVPLTPKRSPVTLGAAIVASITGDGKGAQHSTGFVFSAGTNLKGTGAFCNNAYLMVSPPVASDFKHGQKPAVFAGYSIPIGKGKKSARNLMVETGHLPRR